MSAVGNKPRTRMHFVTRDPTASPCDSRWCKIGGYSLPKLRSSEVRHKRRTDHAGLGEQEIAQRLADSRLPYRFNSVYNKRSRPTATVRPITSLAHVQTTPQFYGSLFGLKKLCSRSTEPSRPPRIHLCYKPQIPPFQTQRRLSPTSKRPETRNTPPPVISHRSGLHP